MTPLLIVMLLLSLAGYSSGTQTTPTISVGKSTSLVLCSSGGASVAQASCSGIELSYSVQAGRSNDYAYVYLMNSTNYQRFQAGVSYRSYPAPYSCEKSSSCNVEWFSAAIMDTSDLVLVVYNGNSLLSMTVEINAQARPVSILKSRIADWAIAVIVVCVVLAMVCGAMGLAWRCGWWCWRGATQPTSQEKYGNLDGRGVYPVNVQMLPVGPGSTAV